MDLGLKGLNVLVTGGTKGIGRRAADMFAKEGVALIYQKFAHPTYSQFGAESFVPGLSIIDALMHCGSKGTGELLAPAPERV